MIPFERMMDKTREKADDGTGLETKTSPDDDDAAATDVKEYYQVSQRENKDLRGERMHGAARGGRKEGLGRSKTKRSNNRSEGEAREVLRRCKNRKMRK